MQRFYHSLPLAFLLCSVNLAAAQPVEKTKPANPLNGPRIETKDAATVTLTTDNSNYLGGEPVKLTLTLKNNGNKAFNILPVDVEWFYQIDVTGPDGKVLPYKKPRRSIYKALTGTNANMQMVDEEPVRPGESIKAVAWLSNLFDMSVPGDYKINAKTMFILGAGNDLVDIKADSYLVKIAPAPLSQWVY